ncbi:isoprenylcysteine carboxylmethyltransferase family protein [Rhizobium sp. P40RR-XXII]|uniref:methyltransferase family protein n=1 Tax=unclassified Rhizobium TaxID=2613769 RepID=UPI0014574348|nr:MULTISPECIES: isoprenylcysteine carboxylmethyltransferase family protein [unclassified Rhizobium]NLR83461.1 isoprenylcysteine carboxylmethyltransferase family protein [Rhizobium sp. P28RR-XV]NLS15881.1 isoprenylcysteine carboxylmethyltransferase family protein [Rhizobium sp. P40RR-XXII]
MNAYRSKSLSFPWSPLLYSLAVLMALYIQRLYPLPLPFIWALASWVVGAILTAVAVTLNVWAVKTLLERRTTVLTQRCSAHLVTTGPFRFTRNPTYLGYTLLTAGLGLMIGNLWFVAMAAAAAALTTFLVIRCEEMHLLSRFGCEFEFYCKHTRRWV